MSGKRYHVEYGLSFNQEHALDLGLNWRKVYTHMLEDLNPPYIRIAAMWNDVEPERGVFDFGNVDFMMDKAAANGTKVVLVVGQKAPRWPECHVPDWYTWGIDSTHGDILYYVENVVKRYKDHPALEIWQVENEPFIGFKFGDCDDFNVDAVEDEIELVKELDPEHKIMITDSGELSTWIPAAFAGDIFGTTMYRIVRTPWGMVFSYDWMPAGFYKLKAKLLGRGYDDFYIAELQAEPWFSDSNPWNTPIHLQEKTMNPDRLKKHMDYAERVGSPRAYLWGVEWWYFMKEYQKDTRYWDIVKEKIRETAPR